MSALRRRRWGGTTLALAALLLAGCAPVATGTASAPTAHSPLASATETPSASAAKTPEPTTALAPIGRTETARVVRVVDGDTIIIDRGRGNERLRYIGMDTPETVKPNTPVQWMGPEASAANKALVDGREVVLEKDVSEIDQYDRLLRYVWLRDGDVWTFVNLELVRLGFAQVATFPPDVRWTDLFLAAQRVAREAGVGLWGPGGSAAH